MPFGQNSIYLQPSTIWPTFPFMVKPNELSLLFDSHLNNFLSELSNDTSRNISILDMPGFGNMFHSFEEKCFDLPWPNQLNMVIYYKVETDAKKANWA